MVNSQAEGLLLEDIIDDDSHQGVDSKPIIPTDPTQTRNAHKVGKARKTSFFDLPREIRDSIYHHYWQADPCLNASNTPCGQGALQLRYEGSYKMGLCGPRYGVLERLDGRYPQSLLSNKQLLQEALEQYTRKAEWFWDGTPLAERPRNPSANLIDVSKISNDMTLHIHSLAMYEDPNRYMDEIIAGKDLHLLAKAIAKKHTTIPRLRISGYSRALYYDDKSGLFDQGQLMIGKIMAYFSGFDIARLELEVFNKSSDRRRILCEVIGQKPYMELILKEDEQHPDPR
ncbi:uncharacterized protein K460DRAFT_412090 [Cucurbitaria berberidis CBS 394.84]|uniref:Uncharacterized protein n=1 Tax=Cucurbitaria berberidis CBS 394.84 TaxID=1168544 RepID=A0A9P4GSR4_9PLEO|nr:uncharacterized protein K460DRAFT_412090 [Cucurbitaria berberidis CBS 394.84]KAF1850376.1 hypothetical protein K460DRAFT_412090 [Cucurbitaria berberidis CBS 394.84]